MTAAITWPPPNCREGAVRPLRFDALGTATELRAMKNYAGHRLSLWLGHLMVSRQKTARPLLTPGEVMQLPPDDELVLVPVALRSAPRKPATSKIAV
jgi:type IV secretory pathway TraG/TraD family ATPase VirD4